MQFQKTLLYVALGLVLVMLWYSWNQFQQDYTIRTNLELQRSVAVNNTNSNLTEDVPTTPEVAAVQQSDNQQVDLPQLVEDSRSTKLIKVRTDLLDVQIDPLGGDVVGVELITYPVSIEQPDQPFVLMYRDNPDLYVAQNGLIGNDRQYPNHNTQYFAAQYDYQLGDDNSLEVALNWTAPDGVAYEKVFTFARNSYRIDIDFRIDNKTEQPWIGFVYGQLKQTRIESARSYLTGGLPSYNGPAIYTEQDKYQKISYDGIDEGALRVATPRGWVAMLQHYFVGAWLPQGANDYQLYSGVSRNTEKPEYRVGYKATQPVTVNSGAQGSISTALFVGPKEQERLDNQNVPGLKLTVDYGWLTVVANPLFWLLTKIHDIVKNWGWSIVLLTFLVKLAFYPLSATSYKSMARMKKLQPRMITLKERFGDDRQKFQQEMMKLYKSEKVNPAGGCLPIIIQIPVFIALYWVLLESVELRQAGFILWIDDLSSPDPYFVLPIVMGASMIGQQFLNPAPVDPIQKKIMMALPFVFTIFFLWFPAGLVLYWVVNNLLSIAQQYYITRQFRDT